MTTKKDARQKAADSGLLPHEWLLSVVRGEPQIERYFVDELDDNDKPVKSLQYKIVYPTVAMRMVAAKDCAQFFAPKHSASQNENRDQVLVISDDFGDGA